MPVFITTMLKHEEQLMLQYSGVCIKAKEDETSLKRQQKNKIDFFGSA